MLINLYIGGCALPCFFFWKEGRKTASLTYVIHRLNRAVLWSTLGVNKRWLVHVELSSEVRALVKAIKSGEAVFVSLTRALKTDFVSFEI